MGIIKVCQHCGSEDVRCDAWAVWNTELQYWELDETFQQEYCQSCEGETRIVDQALPAEPATPARTDPRRVLVTCMRASHSPRAQRWYRVAVAAEFDGEITLLQDFAASINGSSYNHSTKRRSDAVAAAKAHAREKGFTYLAGVWQGVHGHPMKREV